MAIAGSCSALAAAGGDLVRFVDSGEGGGGHSSFSAWQLLAAELFKPNTCREHVSPVASPHRQ